MPENRATIITVKSTDTISHAFQTLIDNKVLSVPVYNVKEHMYIGFIDVVDIVAHALTVFKETEFMGGETPRLLESGERFGGQQVSSVSDLSRRNPWKPVDEKMPISAALDRMVLWKVHRVPVIDSSGELLTLITQSQIVSFIGRYTSQLGELAKKTVGEMKLGLCEVLSVPLDAIAVDAFKIIHSKGVSAVAVVDKNNEIVGNISATDLKLIGYNANMFGKLFLNVEAFLKLIPPNDVFGSGPICVEKTTTFDQVIETMNMAKVHRLYVVDNKKAVGVISHLDILQALPGTHTRKELKQ